MNTLTELGERIIKAEKQYNKMLAERNGLIDDLPWYKAKVSRLEQIRDIKDSALKGADIKIKTLERENAQLKEKNGELQEVIEGKNSDLLFIEDEAKTYKSLLSEISQHIGNKPSSSTYKYFRAKLDNLNITEDK